MADTGEDRVQKMEVDYSAAVEEKIPKCEKLAKVTTGIITLIFNFVSKPKLFLKFCHLSDSCLSFH